MVRNLSTNHLNRSLTLTEVEKPKDVNPGTKKMLKAFKRLWNDERGNMLVISGVALPLLIGAAGLANDTIQWALWKRELQRAADSAAIAGVYDRVQADGSTEHISSAVNRDLKLNNHVGMALVSGYPTISYPADSGTDTDQVKVTLAVQKYLSFSGMFMSKPPLIKASAIAASVPGTDKYCVVSLEDTTATGIEGSGNANVEFSCGMITNSVSTNAATAKGSSYIKATTIAASGGIQESSNWDVDKYNPYTPAQDDPYADLSPETSETSECNSSPKGVLTGGGQTIDLAPSGKPIACYSSITVNSGKSLTLKNGLFLVDGGNVTIRGTLTVENATIVLTNKSGADNANIGTFDANAQATVSITAPTSGKWSGIAVYQDRRAISDTGAIASAPNKINGGSTGNVTGVLYFPKQSLAFLGNASNQYICTQFVVRRIIFTGTNGSANKFDDDCVTAGYEPIEGGRRVRLVA